MANIKYIYTVYIACHKDEVKTFFSILHKLSLLYDLDAK